jgi:hypothetical protein
MSCKDDSCCGCDCRGVMTLLLAMVALLALAMLPELRRYLRIRSM